MLKGLLASIGIGGTKVDTVVENPHVEAGGALEGTVQIRGGDVPQQIDAIHLEVVTKCWIESGDEKVPTEVVVAAAEAPGVQVEPGASHDVPFAIEVPAFAPLSVGSTRSALRTRLDVPAAIDPRDEDALVVAPNAAMRSVIEGVTQAGFQLAEAEVEHTPRREIPFVQELDFRPTSLGDWGIEEVEIAFRPLGGGALEVLLTVDKRGGLFSRGGEAKHRFRVPAEGASPGEIASAIRDAL